MYRLPDIDPVAIYLGPLAVRWYGLMYMLGLLAAWYLANRPVRRALHGWQSEQISDLLFYAFMGVVLGGRLGYVLFYGWQAWAEDLWFPIKIWQGGMSFHGGLLGVAGALYYLGRRWHKPFLAMGDFIAPLIPIGLGAGRLGNFINGELWGRATDPNKFWAVIFPQDPDLLPRHPSQLYECFLEGVVLFALVWWYSSKPRPLGAVSGMFLLGYGVLRFSVEFTREPDVQLGFLWAHLTMGQLLSLPMIGIGAWLLWRKTARREKGN